MTLIITSATASFIHQVTDRLVSQPRSGTFVPVDERANKNLIFLGHDVLLTLGYAGPAFIEQVPSDLWIARRLTQDDSLYDDDRGAIQERFEPKKRWPKGGAALRLLAEDLMARIDSVRGSYGIPAFEVVAAGWQWRFSGRTPDLHTARPVIYRVHNSGGAPKRFQVDSLLRRNIAWSEPTAWTQLVRPGHLTPATENDLMERAARAASIDQLDEIMQVGLVEASKRHPGIGGAAMAVLIPSPRESNEVHARFLPDPTQAQEPGYTPWLITPRQTLAPSLINARYQFDYDPFTFIFDGTQELFLRDDGGIVLFESQSRPRYAQGLVTPARPSLMRGEAPLADLATVALPGAPPAARKIGRNAPCPCGSRRKYKKCHGAGQDDDPRQDDGPRREGGDWVRVFRMEIPFRRDQGGSPDG